MQDTSHSIKRWRQAHGLTQTELAQRSGVGVSTLCKVETGTRNGMRLSALAALVQATESLRPGHGLTAGQILGTEPYPSNGGNGGVAQSGGNGGSPEQTDTAA